MANEFINDTEQPLQPWAWSQITGGSAEPFEAAAQSGFPRNTSAAAMADDALKKSRRFSDIFDPPRV
jgi:hypothetical protein